KLWQMKFWYWAQQVKPANGYRKNLKKEGSPSGRAPLFGSCNICLPKSWTGGTNRSPMILKMYWVVSRPLFVNMWAKPVKPGFGTFKNEIDGFLSIGSDRSGIIDWLDGGAFLQLCLLHYRCTNKSS